jgi:hypothetical protein
VDRLSRDAISGVLSTWEVFYHPRAMKAILVAIGVLAGSAVGEEAPTIDAILKAVQKQAPDATDLPKDVETSAEKIIEPSNAELLFHRRVIQKGDRKLQVLHAITILNSSIAYYERSGAAEHGDSKEDYSKMVRFRKRLADEYVRLTEPEKPGKEPK